MGCENTYSLTNQAHAMVPYIGAGAGQAIEVYLGPLSLTQLSIYAMVVGCLYPGTSSIKLPGLYREHH